MFWIVLYISTISSLWTFDGVWCKDPMAISKTSQPSFYDFLSKIPSSLRKRDLWELVSSSSDVIPIRDSESHGSSISSYLSIQMRLQKLEFYFNALKIMEEDCRQRVLCEVAQDPEKFSPLSSAFLDETRFHGNKEDLSTRLLATNDGARLLTYIDAAERGYAKKDCEIWKYRCPMTTISMINYKSLLLWREMSKWLTVQMIAKP